MLLQNGAFVDANCSTHSFCHKTPLHSASNWGYPETVQILLNHGADVNAIDENLETPLHFAARRGHEKVVEILLKHGARKYFTNNKGQTPLQLAEFFKDNPLAPISWGPEFSKHGDYQKVLDLLKNN